MAESCVYKFLSPSGKVYIGQTSNLNRRLIEHKYRSKKSNLKFYNSISKYGIDNHEIEVLFISDCDYEKDIMEAFYIEYYKSTESGLNINRFSYFINGFKGKKHSKENVLLIKKRMKGFTPIEAINKIKKSIYCGYLNLNFDSISDCARALNVTSSAISMQLSNKRPNKYKVELI